MAKLIEVVFRGVLWLIETRLSGYRTYVVAAGLIGFAAYQLSVGDAGEAARLFNEALIALGVLAATGRAAVGKVAAEVESLRAAVERPAAAASPHPPAGRTLP